MKAAAAPKKAMKKMTAMKRRAMKAAAAPKKAMKKMAAMKRRAMKAAAAPMKAMKKMAVMKRRAMKAAAAPMKAMKKKSVSKIAKGRLAKVMVLRGSKGKTVGGLTAKDLVKSKSGKIVSKKRSAFAKKSPWIAAVKKARAALKI